jgi:hypothetical protein
MPTRQEIGLIPAALQKIARAFNQAARGVRLSAVVAMAIPTETPPPQTDAHLTVGRVAAFDGVLKIFVAARADY